MKHLTIAILTAGAIALSACGKKDGAQVAKEAAAIELPALINPNSLTQENIDTNYDFLPEGILMDWADNAPFADGMAFNTFVRAHMDKGAADKLYETVFVPLDLNTTPEKDFMIIPGVGEKMAHEFEEYRPYSDMAQFDREIGKYVDAAEVARLRRYVVIK
jgi:hypothetical protein